MLFYLSRRFYCHKGTPGSRYVKPLTGVKEFLVQKCFAFVQGYEKILETKFPSAFKIYQVFSVGTKTLYLDIKEYIRISSSLSAGMSVRDMQRKELEVYFQVPKDLRKVAPVLALAALPFANYVILPVIYYFPRLCLSSHFWTLQQKLDFAIAYQRKKLHHYRPVFRQLQAQVQTIQDEKIRNKCQGLFYKIGSGLHPSTHEVLEMKCLFVDKPYGIFQITNTHLVCSIAYADCIESLHFLESSGGFGGTLASSERWIWPSNERDWIPCHNTNYVMHAFLEASTPLDYRRKK